MPHDGYDAFDDPYAYKGSDVLKNRLGIRDADQLQRFELEMWMVRSAEPLPSGHFGAAHYRAIHRHLFQDVYAWAGRYRTVRTAKGGNVVGDIGDGAIHRPEYRCPSGSPPIGRIALGVEGSVCCT